MIRIEIDPEAGPAMYVRLTDNVVARTIHPHSAVLIDLDEHGDAIGVEILGAGEPRRFAVDRVVDESCRYLRSPVGASEACPQCETTCRLAGGDDG